MKSLINKHWLEILTFGAIFGVMLVCLSPNITWMNTDSDGAHYILASKYLTTAHHMSAPLYLLLGHLFLKIPLGTDAWRMGLMSMMAGLATAIIIYLIVRHLLQGKQRARWYALVSSVVYGGSALAISQSTIVETYIPATMCGVLAYYLALRKRWIWASVSLGVGLAIHPFLAFIVWAVMFFAFREMRNWRRYTVTIAFFAFYLYIPIVAHVNPNYDMWGNETAGGFFGGTLGMVLMLTGGLSMWDMPKRFIDTVLILIAGFGLGIVPLVWHFIKQRTWRSSLLWLTIIPPIYFAINLAAETCFPRGTTVLVKKRVGCKGNKTLECAIPAKIENIGIGNIVLSYNTQNGGKEYKKVTHVFQRETQGFITIRLSNGNELRCTPNHPIGINKKGKIVWLNANKLKIGDELIQYNYRGLAGRIWGLKTKGKTIRELYGDEVAEEWSRQSTVNNYRNWSNPSSGFNNPAHHRKVAIGNKRAWQDMKSGHNSEQRRNLRAEHMRYSNPYNNMESRKKLSRTRRKQWAIPAYALKMFKSWKRKPNESETKLLDILDSLCPTEFRYNGDMSQGLILGRKIPDYINVNGKKKLIELFGNYWHKGQNPERLKRHYAKYGFECLVVWESELKDERSLKQKITNYIYNPNTEVVRVIDILHDNKVQDVYNLEVEDNNNYFASGLLVHNCVYMVVGIAFGAIAIGLGLAKMRKWWAIAVAVVAVGLLGFNANYFDIGRTLDPEMSAVKFYEEELAKIPDGGYFMGGGWTWAMVYLYNREEGRNIIPVSIDALPDRNYWAVMDEMGIEYDKALLPTDSDFSYITMQGKLAVSVAEMNDGVWIAKETKPEVYQYEIVPAKGNEAYIGRWIGQEIEAGNWRWRPSNPWKYMSGQLEVAEWHHILWSGTNAFYVVSLIAYGFGLSWFIMMLYKRRKTKVTDEASS